VDLIRSNEEIENFTEEWMVLGFDKWIMTRGAAVWGTG
jgi:hypothetical protein